MRNFSTFTAVGQWRLRPRELGKWNTISAYFKAGREAGVWAQLMAALWQLERKQRQGRQAEPSAGRVDSQSIKTATQIAEVGFDGGKLLKGRKRPVLVDTLGLLIAVVVTAANTEDRGGGHVTRDALLSRRSPAVTKGVGR